MAKPIPQGQELRERLGAIDSKERWRLYRVARRGEAEVDPKKAAIVVAIARQQLRQLIVIVFIMLAWFVGFPLFRWARDPTPDSGANFLGAVIGFAIVGLPVMWFFARRYKRAERLNLEVVEQRPPRKSKRR